MALPGVTTLGTIRTTVRQRTDNVNSQFVSDPELNGWINAAYQEVYGQIVQHFGCDYSVNGPSFYQFTTDGVTQLFSLPDGSAGFLNPDSTTAPAFFKLLGVDLLISAPGYYVSLKEFQLAERNNVSIFNNVTPMAGQQIRLIYAPRVTLLVNDGDSLDMVNGWEEGIIHRVCLQVAAKEESDASLFVAQLAAMDKRLETEIENRNAMGSHRISDVLGKRARSMKFHLTGSKIWLLGNGMPGFPSQGDWAGDEDGSMPWNY